MSRIARVFFVYARDGSLVRVAFQPLANHQENVTSLVQAWHDDPAESLSVNPNTRELLLAAARHHDDGKPQCFRIVTGKDTRLGYSFSGHRFRISDEITHPYVRELIRGHHDYSTANIVEAAAALRRVDFPQYDRFPRDLYVLEMCDQIEAEIAVREFEGVGESRPFMDFTLYRETDGCYALDPYPFATEEVGLVSEARWKEVARGEDTADQIRSWADRIAELSTDRREIRLCPLR